MMSDNAEMKWMNIVKHYARACVAHATAAKDAEIEALRAEVKDYRTNGAAAVRFAPSSAHWSKELRRLFGDDARTGIEVLENRHRQELARVERLAEALREAEKDLRQLSVINCGCKPCRSACRTGKGAEWELESRMETAHAAANKARAALHPTSAQENDDA